jgi:CheY-like chemotaxis protein
MAQVLLIDDDPKMRTTLRRILESAGHAVLEAGNGREGLSLFQSRAFDVVVTDIIMPEKEGIETIIELRRTARGSRILAISGGGHAGKVDFLAVAKKLGADLVLQKPIRAAELLRAVATLVEAPPPAATGTR